MAHSSADFLVKKMAKTKISDDIYLGEDLSLETYFLTAVTENLGKDLEH